MQRILVADIMTRDPITISPDATLLDCAKRMVKKKVGSLLITYKKKLVGFISEKDILWALIKKSKDDLSKINALEIAPKKIATLKPFMSIAEAVKKMKNLKIGRLPVIHEGELVGMITTKDILGFYPELYSELDEIDTIRDETGKLKRLKKAQVRNFVQRGICEECGKEDVLYNLHGMLICESCRNEM